MQREDRNYTHSYQYFGGWLGQEEVDKEKKRKKALGKIDMLPVAPPPHAEMRTTIEKIAQHVMMKKTEEERRIFEKMIREKNVGNYMFCFLDEPNRPVAGLGAIKTDTEDGPVQAIAGDKGEQQKAREYYLFVKHCIEREVDFTPIAEKQTRLEKDREEKLNRAKRPPEFSQPKGAEKSCSSTAKGPGEEIPPEPMFNDGVRVEILGLEKRADLNGQHGKVVKFYADVGRYEVRLDKFGTVIKVKASNLLYAAVQTDTADKEKKESDKFGDIMKDAKVEILGLASEAARWLNGQEGFVVGYDEEAQRYEIKLLRDANQIKRVKRDNLRLSLPEGWVEYFDEHAQKAYYINRETNKATWKHPVQTQTQTKFDTVVEANEDLEEADFGERETYDCDKMEECEGQFNLDDLVRKVQEREEALDSDNEAAEPPEKKPKTDEPKKAKKKKTVFTLDDLRLKLEELKKDLPPSKWTPMPEEFTKVVVQRTLSDAQMELEKELSAACEEKREAVASKRFRSSVIAALIRAMEVTADLLEKQPKSKFTLQGLQRLANKLDILETPRELVNEVDYLHSLLKTM